MIKKYMLCEESGDIIKCYYFNDYSEIEDIINSLEELDRKKYFLFENLISNKCIKKIELSKYKQDEKINLNTLLYSLIMYSVINNKQEEYLTSLIKRVI